MYRNISGVRYLPVCVRIYCSIAHSYFNLFAGERPFKCPFVGCNRSFTTSNIRKVHIRTHTGERPYVCTEPGCNKSFASATNYKNHIRIHTGMYVIWSLVGSGGQVSEKC